MSGRMAWALAAGVLAASLAAGGCARSTRALTRAELDVTERLHARLVANRAAMAKALDDVLAVQLEGLAVQASLGASLAKAQLLDAMKAPWVAAGGEMAATRQEVALYALYALHEAEREAREAREAARRAAVGDVLEAYDDLVSLTDALVEAERLLVSQASPSVHARLSAYVRGVMERAASYADRLAKQRAAQAGAEAAGGARVEERLLETRRLLEKALEGR